MIRRGSRGGDWTLTVIDPFTGTTLDALTHNGVFRNATGGTTPSYSYGISGSAWEIPMEVTGPGGSDYGDCSTNRASGWVPAALGAGRSAAILH